MIDDTITQFEGDLTFVRPDSSLGQRAIMNESVQWPDDDAELAGVDGKGKLYSTIKEKGGCWIGRIGEHTLTAFHPTLEACKQTVLERYKYREESFLSDYEDDLLERWEKNRDYSVEPLLGGLLGVAWLCTEDQGYGIVMKMYHDKYNYIQVYDSNNKPAGMFRIKKNPPRNEDDIVEVKPERCGFFTPDVKKKILAWSRGSNFSRPTNWEFLVYLRGVIRQSRR